ncbi:hypothetical protein Q2339_24525, partial [Escherichia coli]|nr:hypothetical protein [Escherichia coli]
PGFNSPALIFSRNASAICRYIGLLPIVSRLFNTFSGNYAFSGGFVNNTNKIQISVLVKMIT